MKNVVAGVGLRALIGASALLAACTAQEAEDTGMRVGTYAVTGLDLGTCADEAWVPSGTSTTSLVVEADGDDFVVSTCGDAGCTKASPSRYTLSDDLWRGQDGGAYLVETGCLLLHVDATMRVEGTELVFEATRWSEVATGACTVDAVTAMRSRPCDGRTRLSAVEQ